MARRSRRALRDVEEAVDVTEASDDEPTSCVVCEKLNTRVTVACDACAKVYHLACHSPPLRRRPAATAQWTCVACEDGDEAKEETGRLEHQSRPLSAKRRSSRNGVASEPAVESKEEEEEEEEHENGGNARKRRRASGTGANPKSNGGDEASSAPKQSKAEVRDADMSDSDAPLSKTVSPASKLKQAKTTARKKLPSRKMLKVQEPELAAKRSTRALQRSRGPASGRKVVTLVDSDEDMEEEDGDDDNDSDFEEADETEEDDKDDSADSVSDEDFQAPLKLPTRAKSPTKPKKSPQPKKSPNGKGKKAATPTKRGNTVSPADDDATNASTQAGADSMEPDVDQESEEEEEYTGPQYSVEYSPNARSKCKDCEEKIVKDELRVGVFVRHSMFGMTTYYKHLKCSKICWDTAEKLRERAQKAAEAAAAAAAAAGQTDSDEMILSPSQKTPSNEPIRGFASLKPKEQEIVCAHMTENMNAGVLDERLELTEDQYNRKTRMPEKDPSPLLTVPLLPYQREALAWMTEQEKSEYRGGILADEMGMGKTIQAISLILESPRGHPIKAEPRATNKGKGRAGKTADPAMPRGGTLVVCPVVAVMQWKSEIERFVERNHLSIYIHHGQKRLDNLEKIASYDIVLTTYSIIEAESRKSLGWEKVACRYCKKKYLPDKLVLHNKYFCGPNAKKTALQDRQVTKKKKQKKAAGESSSEESEDDLKKPVKGKTPAKRKQLLKKKAIDSDEDGSDSDVADKPIRKAKQGKSPLHSIHWARIVLDEAHYIKDRRCNTARGVFELKSDYKWCLTGTPLQNRIGELFSLVRFLQVKYYAYYHCNKCECQMLDYDFPDNKCAHCDHPAMHHFSYFNKKIVIPIQSYGYVAEGKVAMLRLQNEVLQHILLRRTKEGRADDIALPPKLIRIRRDRLDERENDFYQAIYTQSQAQFNTYVSSGTLLNNYAHIFDLLIRLRQAVDHPYLVIYSKSNPALQMPVAMDSTAATFIRPVIEQKPLISHTTDDDDGVKSPGANEVLCAICHEDVEDPVTAKCRHVFCRECVKEFIESLPEGASATCPTCEKALTVDLSPPKPSEDFGEPETPTKANVRRPQVDLSRYHKHSILHRISDMASFQTSTKIEALMQELEHMKARDPSGKAIIFSQFVNLLDIIQHRLTLGGIKCVKLSGNMTMDARDRTIRAFREDNSISAFLISLKAGGVALNLTIASHIFLMDPWWNPAAENQAIDRTHRLGQFKPVEATRFIIAGTIEERILKLQEKKRLIFEGTVGASVSAICRLTEEDLRFLFSK